MLLFIILILFIAIAAGLAWYLIAHDHGEREPISALWLAVAFGFVGALAAAAFEAWLISVKNVTPGAPLPVLLTSSLAVGVIEEACKFLPLAFFLYPKRYFNEHTDGVIYFGLAGLGFGLPENIIYSLQYGSGVGLGRVILTPFFHAAITAMVGFFLARSKLAHQSLRPTFYVLIGAMVLHGLYDFGLASGVAVYALLSIVITLSLSAALFLLFMKATELDQAEGRAVARLALPLHARHHVKLVLAIIFGGIGIAVALFVPLLAIILGIAAAVLVTTASAGAGRAIKITGLTLASLAILAGLAAWVYVVVHDPRLHTSLVASQTQPAGASSRSAVTVNTPCYDVTFAGQLTVENQPGSCELNAYNGSSLAGSSNVYKILTSNAPALTAAAFPALAKAAIEKDVSANLPGYTITGETPGQFAGSPDYVVNTASTANVTVVEAAVLHSSADDNNFFILVHATRGSKTDLSGLERGWQWK
jgi:protease PrsW